MGYSSGRGPVVGQYRPTPVWPVAAWKTLSGTQSNSQTAQDEGFLVGHHIEVPTAMTFDRICVIVQTAYTGGTPVIGLGIYNCDATTLFPSSLVLDAGTVSVATTGIKTITINQALAPGMYWLASLVTGGTASDGVMISSTLTNLVYDTTAGGPGSFDYTYRKTGLSALPNPYSTDAVSISSSPASVYLRRSA